MRKATEVSRFNTAVTTPTMATAPHEEEHTARSGAGQTVARRRERAVFVGNQANQQQPGNQYEWCPVLRRSRPRCRRVQRNGDHQSGDADAGEAPTKQTLPIAAGLQGHDVVVHRLRIDHSPKLGRSENGPAEACELCFR